MESMIHGKLDTLRVFSSIFSIIGFLLFLVTIYQGSMLRSNQEGLTQMEYISSEVQRLTKLELEGNTEDVLIATLDMAIEELIPANKIDAHFKENQTIITSVQAFYENWDIFKESIELFRKDNDRDEFFLASEIIYSNSIEEITEVSDYIDNFDKIAKRVDLILIIDTVIIIAIFAKILLNTNSELEKNKELSKDMFIDTSTGLYNSSKCQEVLKKPADARNSKERAVVIFDLNDLKKTNDNLGHRAGDQLISSFAEQLRNATSIFSLDVFVGRYGGDEFMVSFDFITKDDVELYINEVQQLIKIFNETQNKPFKLSCAVGYAITTKETKSLTTRELFDIADGAMYVNKLAMKQKIKQDAYEKETKNNKTNDKAI